MLMVTGNRVQKICSGLPCKYYVWKMLCSGVADVFKKGIEPAAKCKNL